MSFEIILMPLMELPLLAACLWAHGPPVEKDQETCTQIMSMLILLKIESTEKDSPELELSPQLSVFSGL